MKNPIHLCVACVLIGCALLSAGCGDKRPPPLSRPPIDAHAGQKALEQCGVTAKGYFDKDRLATYPGLKMALADVRRDAHGRLTAEGIDARVQAWKDLGIARLVLPCKIMHGNAPLVGAVVTLVPASFLGPEMKTGSGTTGAGGMAMISVAGLDPPGMPPGFYTIQVTKPGESIPARYNTATTLGAEVASDNPRLAQGIELNLEY
jgi:hypothetical protein